MRKIALLFIVSLFTFIGTSQTSSQKKTPKIIQKTFYYSFDNIQDQNDMQLLVEDLEKEKNVVKVKLNYKVEKNAGQVIVILHEPERTSEQEVFFSPKTIKNLMIQHHLTPGKMSVNEVVIENK